MAHRVIGLLALTCAGLVAAGGGCRKSDDTCFAWGRQETCCACDQPRAVEKCECEDGERHPLACPRGAICRTTYLQRNMLWCCPDGCDAGTTRCGLALPGCFSIHQCATTSRCWKAVEAEHSQPGFDPESCELPPLNDAGRISWPWPDAGVH